VGVPLLVDVGHQEAELVVVAGEHDRPLAAPQGAYDVADDVHGDAVAVLRELPDDPVPPLLLEARHGGRVHQVLQDLVKFYHRDHISLLILPVRKKGSRFCGYQGTAYNNGQITLGEPSYPSVKKGGVEHDGHPACP
jgi:hypothetical protein